MHVYIQKPLQRTLSCCCLSSTSVEYLRHEKTLRLTEIDECSCEFHRHIYFSKSTISTSATYARLQPYHQQMNRIIKFMFNILIVYFFSIVGFLKNIIAV